MIMNERTIISSEDIRKVRPIAENVVDCKRIEPYIREVEQLDVMPTIGVDLYRQLTDEGFLDALEKDGSVTILTAGGCSIALTGEGWEALVNGGYHSGGTKYSAGLRATVAYLAYARMLPNQPISVTAFGVVQKNTTLSEPVDEKTLLRAANEARKIGLEYLRQSVEHLRCLGLFGEQKKSALRYRKFIAIGD
jgi:hypothetical protein